MASDVLNRQTIREAMAALLVTELEGPNKPAQKVYNHRVRDFNGRSPVVVVASRPTDRSKQAQVTRVSSLVKLDVHTFVLYSEAGVTASNSPTAGNNKVINLSDTSTFTVGDAVTIMDDSNSEAATITAITDDVSITVGTLAYSYATPKIYSWTERNAEDRLDLLEKSISDMVMDNDTTEMWAQLSFEGESTHDDVAIGGLEYLHEVFHLNFRLHSD